jgi:hypothetical protein
MTMEHDWEYEGMMGNNPSAGYLIYCCRKCGKYTQVLTEAEPDPHGCEGPDDGGLRA